LVSYISGESGDSTMPFDDAEALRKTLSKITSFRYEIMEAKPDFPPPSENAKWYLLVNEEISKIYHSRLIWIDKEGRIKIESMYLGNTDEWIEQDYGEEGATSAMNPAGSDLMAVREYLAEHFPLEYERLETYQKILDDISSKYGITLGLSCTGGKFVATFFMGATIEVKGMNEEEKAKRIRLNLKGLKEALRRISEHEIELEKRRIQQM